jgi:hypothetical protein
MSKGEKKGGVLTMVYKTSEEKIKELAKKLSDVKLFNNKDKVATLGFFLGAIYSLKKAIELGYMDETGLQYNEDYPEMCKKIAIKLSTEEDDLKEENEIQWLAGYYFNSALMRTAAIADRLELKKEYPDIYKEVNRLKHDEEGILSGKRDGRDIKVTIEHIISKLSQLVARINT